MKPNNEAVLREALIEAAYSLPDSYVSLQQKIRHVLAETATANTEGKIVAKDGGEPVAWMTEPTSAAHPSMRREVMFDKPQAVKADFTVTPLYTHPHPEAIAEQPAGEVKTLLLEWWQTGMDHAEFFNRASVLLGVTSSDYLAAPISEDTEQNSSSKFSSTCPVPATASIGEDAEFPSDLIGQLREYAGNSGYSHGDYADTMRQAADALNTRAAASRNAGVVPELSKAFITLENLGGDGRYIVLKFNQRADAYAVHDFLLKGGIKESPATTPDTSARDAARYRWLRLQDWFDNTLCVLRNPKDVLQSNRGLGADCPSRDRLDAAIDAAIEQRKADKKGDV